MPHAEKAVPLDSKTPGKPNASPNSSFSAVIRHSLYCSVFFKVVTFAFNQLLVKFIAPPLLAYNNFLDFLVNTTIFFTSEGIRLSTQRISGDKAIEEQQVASTDSEKGDAGKVRAGTYRGALQSVINLSYVPVVLGTVVSPLIICMQFSSFSQYFSNNGLHSQAAISSAQNSRNFMLVLNAISGDQTNSLVTARQGFLLALRWFLETSNETQLVIVVLFAIITIFVNLVTEKFLNVANFKSQFHLRAKFESFGLIVNCVFNFALIAVASNILSGFSEETVVSKKHGTALAGAADGIFQKLVILFFTLGRLLNSVAVYVLYLSNFENNETDLWMRKIYHSEKGQKNAVSGQSYYFDTLVIHYWRTIFLQLIFKNFLTEGDKFIFNYFFTSSQQGIYSLVNNYGSLITRLLFNPIEESLKLHLSKLFNISAGASASAPTSSTLDTGSSNKVLQREPENKNKVPVKSLRSSQNTIQLISKFYVYLSFIILIFGYFNAPFLAEFLFTRIIKVNWWNSLGSDSSEDLPSVVATYVLYLPFLAFNGIFEAFFQSITTAVSIKRYSFYLSACSALYFLNCYFFIRGVLLGLRGLIVANVANMLLRIAYCFIMINDFYNVNNATTKRREFRLAFDFNNVVSSWRKMVPVSAVFLAVQGFGIGKTSSFADLFKSAALGVAYVGVVVYNERQFVVDLLASGDSSIARSASAVMGHKLDSKKEK